MTVNDQLTGTPLSRRRLLQGGALFGAAAFLAACGTKGTATEPPTSAPASTAPSMAPSQAAASAASSAAPSVAASAAPSPTPAVPMIANGTPADVVWANWPLYIDVDNNGKHPTIQAFEKKYGVKVTYKEAINDNNDFFGKIQPNLQAGQPTGWDLITMTDWMAARLIGLGWIERLNPAAMPNFQANIKATYRGVNWDPNLDFHAPWQSGMTGIGFDPKVCGNVTSLKSFFTADPRWTGKVDMLTEMRDTIGLTMLSLGLDPSAPTRAAFDQCITALKAAKDAGIVRRFTGNDYSQDLTAGDAVLAMVWSGDMVQLLAEGKALKFSLGTEGGMLWTDNMMIPKGAAQPYTAELLMDWYYIPEQAAAVEDYVNYICPVNGAATVLKKIDPSVASNPLIFPTDATLAECKIFGGLSADDEQYFNTGFDNLINGA
jgi:spermidine/putrescine transport system substrate-binding protein